MAGETSRFHWVDYFVLALMLLFSSIIGLYFAFAGKKAIQRNKTTGELFLGGRGLTLFPVTMSVTASFVSGKVAIIILCENNWMPLYHNIFWFSIVLTRYFCSWNPCRNVFKWSCLYVSWIFLFHYISSSCPCLCTDPLSSWNKQCSRGLFDFLISFFIILLNYNIIPHAYI